MHITRRQLLKGAAATAVLAHTHLLSRVRPAAGALVGDPILVLVNLDGGWDPFHTVIPLDDVGAPQRSVYERLRPDLAIALRDLEGTGIGSDPVRGTGLALHPNLEELVALFDEGKLALVNGVGFADSSLSHFVARDVWYSGDPDSRPGTGWVGRQMDAGGLGPEPQALSFGDGVNLTLASAASDTIGTRSISGFDLPPPPIRTAGEAHRSAWEAIYGGARDPSSLADRVARSGSLVLSSSDAFRSIETDGWGSHNDDALSHLGDQLREVASILRHDALNPAEATSLRFFHVALSGFDTHANQGTTSEECGHGRLLRQVSSSLAGFQRDLSDLGVADRVVTLAYSEFGRRAAQNGSGASAGTDHGRAGLVMLMGEPVNGGLHGAVPDLSDLDEDGNPRVSIDFRRVYATLIDRWIGGDHTAVLPGAPFETLPILL